MSTSREGEREKETIETIKDRNDLMRNIKREIIIYVVLTRGSPSFPITSWHLKRLFSFWVCKETSKDGQNVKLMKILLEVVSFA